LNAGLHGFGRFAQHLLFSWLSHSRQFSIPYLVDEILSLEDVYQLITDHDRLDFSRFSPRLGAEGVVLIHSDGGEVEINYTCGIAAEVPWLGEVDLWLECSGRNSSIAACEPFMKGRTRQAIISATCWDADQTLVMGLNENQWSSRAKVLSYGSCTVNAFVPLADWLHQQYGVQQAYVNVVHNLPQHQLPAHSDPEWKICTLEKMAPRILPWLSNEQIFVSYATVPYAGGSLIEFNFRLNRVPSKQEVLQKLQHALENTLKGLYRIETEDSGVVGVLGARENAVFPLSGIEVIGDNLRFRGYFDNENSAVRYLQLVELIVGN
jgi:glyceraldehyde 3-phosphate dehydrogenase